LIQRLKILSSFHFPFDVIRLIVIQRFFEFLLSSLELYLSIENIFQSSDPIFRLSHTRRDYYYRSILLLEDTKLIPLMLTKVSLLYQHIIFFMHKNSTNIFDSKLRILPNPYRCFRFFSLKHSDCGVHHVNEYGYRPRLGKEWEKVRMDDPCSLRWRKRKQLRDTFSREVHETKTQEDYNE
jgi:hypothetical protein